MQIKLMSAVFGMLIASVLMTMSTGVLADWGGRGTSEEHPPLTASNQNLINRLFCSGGYCDNVWINSVRTNRNFGSNYWTPYFSEEGTNWQICSGSGFVTGVSCQGSYCDNLSLQCTTLEATTRGGCYWTPYFSEEAGYSSALPAGYYAAGMQCQGAYCDNKRILACLAY